MKKGCVIFILSLGLQLFSQTYIPIDTADMEKRKHFVQEYETANKLFIKNLEEQYSGIERREISNSFEEFSKNFSKQITAGKFIFNEKFTSKVEEILHELQNKNPIIPKDLRVLVAKDGSLNAYCMGDGTFVINLGLFYWMDSEDQIASVMAHEIGHKVLNHPVKTIYDQIKYNNSKETKNVIKTIRRQKFNKSESAFKIFKENMYATGFKRRKQEYAADSIGYILLKKTKYNKLDYLQALKLMEKYDTLKPKGLNKEIYKKFFNLPNAPFKEEWLKIEDFSAYDYSKYKEKFDKDSLASHPETVDRIKKIQTLFPELQEVEKTMEMSNSLKEINKISEYEQVPNLYFSEEYGAGIYLSLLNLQYDRDDVFYKKWLGKCFQKIYEARKNYTLNRYLDRIEPKEQSESYQQFLNFMWNLSLTDIKLITEFYNK